MFEESLVEELRARKFHRKPSLIKKEEEKERLKRRGRFRRRLRNHA
jgi:ribosomal protein S21